MVGNLLRKVFGSRNDRLVKHYSKTVILINALEDEMAALTDEALSARTDTLRERFQKGETLDALLPEAFAVCREAGKRIMGMRHFDVQLIGAMALHDGKIAEMRTGEGKTLVATLAVYLNALSGKGVHVVTVNDYLAKRDAEWMEPLYNFLGMRVGVIIAGMGADAKRESYAADITYGTNNQYGFDYLQDNLAFSIEDKMQRELNFAVVDEVDSILIDEARTPLIISGEAEDSSDLYRVINKLIPQLSKQQEEDGEGDYSVDEKSRQALLTEEGHEHVEELLTREGLLKEGDSLYDAANIMLMHHVDSALRAHALYQRDVHYVVQNGEIVIVDEFTGRTSPGRRWSEGLHQAIEAKEAVNIQNESRTVASITFQNYFRLYNNLSGMTGTADTEAFEFQSIYGLEVVIIPTHRPMVRNDMSDLVFLSQQEKFNAVIEDIQDCQQRGQPVLVGTASIEASEHLSEMLKKMAIKHAVLNAKFHEREAEIIAQAGLPGAVTIATNMAGRGTDIMLGGNIDVELAGQGSLSESEREKLVNAWQQRHDDVLSKGGLHIIGTERHESRRIDNQLRGRSGRQGDVGSSRFYVSLDDNLMRIFASERVASIMQRLGMEEGEAIEHPWITRAIENAQRKVEGHNFDIRKQLLEYDDVANDQRREIYAMRNEIMAEADVSDRIESIRADVLNTVIDEFIPPQSPDDLWDIPGLEEALEAEFLLKLDIQYWLKNEPTLHEESLRERILDELVRAYQEKETHAGGEVLRHFEKAVMLQVLDSFWKDHLSAMDYLRQSIGLRSMAQKNPKQEFKREAFEMFADMIERIKHDIISILSKVQIRDEEDVEAVEEQRRRQGQMHFEHAEAGAMAAEEAGPAEGDEALQAPFVRNQAKVGRNEPCPCGSGKKYKSCHGKLN
ncbi:preprotein translocase subunit SecA [Sulfuriflexus mobilis]|uniref:preprotein translocase subunit SecA n=1 Tax=Sulfuriflexus mobilis TaxID=1811807 RepID=UPI000F830172|nr:preprotein translocase subunit SecA [Sulfuriflexus mobilis]